MVYLAAAVYEASRENGSYRLSWRIEGNPETPEDDINKSLKFADYKSMASFLRESFQKGGKITCSNLLPSEEKGIHKIINDCEKQNNVFCEL